MCVSMHLCMYNYDACVNAYNIVMHVWYPLYDNVALVRDRLTCEACELIKEHIVISMDLNSMVVLSKCRAPRHLTQLS